MGWLEDNYARAGERAAAAGREIAERDASISALLEMVRMLYVELHSEHYGWEHDEWSVACDACGVLVDARQLLKRHGIGPSNGIQELPASAESEPDEDEEG